MIKFIIIQECLWLITIYIVNHKLNKNLYITKAYRYIGFFLMLLPGAYLLLLIILIKIITNE